MKPWGKSSARHGRELARSWAANPPGAAGSDVSGLEKPNSLQAGRKRSRFKTEAVTLPPSPANPGLWQCGMEPDKIHARCGSGEGFETQGYFWRQAVLRASGDRREQEELEPLNLLQCPWLGSVGLLLLPAVTTGRNCPSEEPAGGDVPMSPPVPKPQRLGLG